MVARLEKSNTSSRHRAREQSVSFHLPSILKRPSFWVMAAIIIVLTVFHYSSMVEQGAMADLTSRLGLTRHAFERIAYIIPVMIAGWMYGRRMSFAVSMVTLACMLPRAIAFSPAPADALVETVAVFVLGHTIALTFTSLRRERERSDQLEMTEKSLQFQLRITKENEKSLSALNRACETLSQSLEAGDILDRAAGVAVDVMEVEASLIHLVDDDGGSLSLAVYHGVPTQLVQEAQAIRMGEDIIGRVARTGTPICVENASRDAAMEGSALKARWVQSLMCVPMKYHGSVIGTICILSDKYRWFRDYEVHLLTAIGGRVAVALENARLCEQQRLAARKPAGSE